MMSLQLGYSQVHQDSFYNQGNIIITKPSIKISKFDSTIKVLKRPLFQNYSSSLLALEVKEVYEPWETCEPFSDDYGHFSYCGDIVGGIKNLLETDLGSIPHLRFENQPMEKRKVYFYGIGLNVRLQKSKDTVNSLFSDRRYVNNTHYIDCRAIILKTMEDHFQFEVIETEDSLDLLELQIVDINKLYSLRSNESECIKRKGGNGWVDTISGDYISSCLPLEFIAYNTEITLNTYTKDMTGNRDYYSFRMPKKYIEPNIKLEDLNNYLEENLGVKFFKKKKFSKVYTIKFKNGKE